jgi:hypothetical protein
VKFLETKQDLLGFRGLSLDLLVENFGMELLPKPKSSVSCNVTVGRTPFAPALFGVWT